MGQTKEQRIIKQLSGGTVQKQTAIATDMFLPNHSGDNSAGDILKTPVKDTDIPNKKYVDDADALLVPYTAATGDVDLGAFDLTANIMRAAEWQGIAGVAPVLVTNDINMSDNNITAITDIAINGNIDLGTNTITNGSMVGDWSFGSGDLTTTGTIQAEQLTSTDDITAQGESFSLGSNNDLQKIITFVGSTNTGYIIYNPFGNAFDLGTSNLFMSGLIDLGVGTIDDQQMTGDWIITSVGQDALTLTRTNSVAFRLTDTGVDGGDWRFKTADGEFKIRDMDAASDRFVIDTSGNILLPLDNQILKIGLTNTDLQISSDGTNGIIDCGTAVRIGNATTNYTNFDSGGFQEAFGTAIAYKDINMAGYLLAKPASSAPGVVTFLDEAGTDTLIETYGFAVGEKVHGGFELQHDYKEGTDLTFHVHWQGIADPSGTDNVQWRLTYVVMRDGTTLNAAVTIDSPDTPFDTQYESVRTDFAAITGTNFIIGDQFMFTLERVSATGDAYAGEALIATAGIHYQVNTLGSRTIAAK